MWVSPDIYIYYGGKLHLPSLLGICIYMEIRLILLDKIVTHAITLCADCFGSRKHTSKCCYTAHRLLNWVSIPSIVNSCWRDWCLESLDSRGIFYFICTSYTPPPQRSQYTLKIVRQLLSGNIANNFLEKKNINFMLKMLLLMFINIPVIWKVVQRTGEYHRESAEHSR